MGQKTQIFYGTTQMTPLFRDVSFVRGNGRKTVLAYLFRQKSIAGDNLRAALVGAYTVSPLAVPMAKAPAVSRIMALS